MPGLAIEREILIEAPVKVVAHHRRTRPDKRPRGLVCSAGLRRVRSLIRQAWTTYRWDDRPAKRP
jgi:hypothetical protein